MTKDQLNQIADRFSKLNFKMIYAVVSPQELRAMSIQQGILRQYCKSLCEKFKVPNKKRKMSFDEVISQIVSIHSQTLSCTDEFLQ